VISLRRYRVPSRLTRNQRREQLRKLGLKGQIGGATTNGPRNGASVADNPAAAVGPHERGLDQGSRCRAGDENRTRMTSLEGWGSAIELHPRFRDDLEHVRRPRCNHGVGATGLEPAIFCSQSRRASHYATPRPSDSAERSRTSVGHASVPTNPVGCTCRTKVWPGQTLPVGLPRLSVSHSRRSALPLSQE
jgi:hypothetical protein